MPREIETASMLRHESPALSRGESAPLMDIEWLALRCNDTLAYTGGLQRDSIRELKKDAARFVDEWPGLLSPSLLEALGSIAEDYGLRLPSPVSRSVLQ